MKQTLGVAVPPLDKDSVENPPLAVVRAGKVKLILANAIQVIGLPKQPVEHPVERGYMQGMVGEPTAGFEHPPGFAAGPCEIG